MDSVKKQATAAQVTALMDFMQEHSEVARGLQNSGLGREDLEAQWRELTATLNAMGGAVKSVEKWKQTWRDLKSNTKKRALKQQHSVSETVIAQGSDNSQSADLTADGDCYAPPKKKFASFDEEIIRIEKEKLLLDKEYKAQKIEVLSRIASALEELARKKDNT